MLVKKLSTIFQRLSINHFIYVRAIVEIVKAPPITIADQVFLEMQQAIVYGEMQPGSKISEPELAKKYQISRSTLRDALNRLENCKLLSRIPNIGCRVVELSIQNLNDLFAVREMLEGKACRLAAQLMSDEEIEKMTSLIQQQEYDASLQHPITTYQEGDDLDFHHRIIMASGNQMLIHLLNNELYHLVRMYRFQLGLNNPRLSKSLFEHQQILFALQERDSELAEILMRRHIEASRKVIEKQLI